MKTRQLMTRAVSGTVRQAVRALLYGVVGGAIVLLVVFVRYLDGRPDLELWHTAELDAEFTADSPIQSFEDDLALEKRLFAQLDERVYDEVEPSERRAISRYSRGSTADPSRWPSNWNRSFERPAASPAAGVLLVHGMSDSPYSMRALAQRLHAEGAWVVGLRVPGHGTAPVGLIDVEWEDMAAAVVLAMRHLSAKQQLRQRKIMNLPQLPHRPIMSQTNFISSFQRHISFHLTFRSQISPNESPSILNTVRRSNPDLHAAQA